MSRVVFITGCSTGIGRDLALQLTRTGYTVVATARKVETLEDLPVACRLPLDVTSTDSIRLAVQHTLASFGRIDILVNNAGYALRGAVEEIPVEQAQAMYDVNVFGVMRMIQAVVPHMRRAGRGQIINISSIAGRLVTPGNGSYASTKFALEALSDALRWELEPFGVQVVLIEPGAIKTQFEGTVKSHAWSILDNPASPYRALYQQSATVDIGMRRQEPGPETVSQVVRQVIETEQPKARYLVGFGLSGKLVLWLGNSVWERVVRQMFRLNGVNRRIQGEAV